MKQKRNHVVYCLYIKKGQTDILQNAKQNLHTENGQYAGIVPSSFIKEKRRLHINFKKKTISGHLWQYY